MVKMGEYNVLKVIKEKSMGVFLDDGDVGILLPKRFVPAGVKIGMSWKFFYIMMEKTGRLLPLKSP
jgi:hypothetical protein